MTTPSPSARLRGSHPLDFLPLFQRWPRTPLRSIVMTAALSMTIGGAISLVQVMLLGRARVLDAVLPMIVIGNMVGFLVHGGLVGLALLLRGWPHRQTGPVRSVYYISVVAVLSVIGIALGNDVLQGRNPLHYLDDYAELAPIVPFALVMSLLMLVLTTVAQRRAQAELQQVRQREEIAATAQLLTEAKLRALQAQIEPHFLYNTLANVLSLIDTQPAQARHMLERFIDFLRASLHASRADSATVGAELDLAAAYLDVLAVRMGQRLRYRIEADDAARAATIAPMLIQPLVENAVMHGLEPKVAGGTIVLRAHVVDGHLAIEVADDGVGIGNAPPRSGGGVGMANVKARAQSVHGAAAQVQLLENPGGGAIVRLVLPIQSTLIEVPSSLPPPH
jgi:signal transduction histidine kinase